LAYNNKIAIVIKNYFANWKKLDVASSLAKPVAIKFSNTPENPFLNASNCEYLPFIKHPIFTFKAETDAEIKKN
jgi:hypothetical protein